MSDFDKEAERERLREKYERDEKKREATERMSDLLLKGATMTNAHCENCGDPIFRHEGQEFCPTCQQLVESGDADETAGETDGDRDADDAADDEESEDHEADEGEDDETDAGTPASIEVKRPTGPTADEMDASGDAATADAEPDQPESPDETDPQDVRETPAESAERQGRDRTTPRQQPSTTAPSQSTTAPSPPAGATGTTGESGNRLQGARASLTQALEFHAAQAAETADPRRAKDHLAAAREAAEALSALY